MEYVSQDICIYDGIGDGSGAQTGTWDTRGIDIISDIIAIPVPEKSFDYILCTEVFEHIINPELAMKEFARILKSGGRLILTAPFTSWTHFAPYHYYTGINKYWYKEMCERYNLRILEIIANGNAFRQTQMECTQAAEIYNKYTGKDITDSELLLLKQASHLLDRMATEGDASSEFCNTGYQLLIEKL